jgi:hypothetical protein
MKRAIHERSCRSWCLAALISAAVGLLGTEALHAATGVAEALLVRGPHPAHADGGLGAEIWQTAKPIGDFLQREPREGAPPSQHTEFRVAYDETMLYVTVRAFETDPDKIVSVLTRRDEDSPSDWLRVFIDSYRDRRTAYEFAVNPSGVKQDRYWFNDSYKDASWDAVWDVVVSRDRQGWTAEFRIPFSQLRFIGAESQTFGFAVVREIARLNETSTWPLLSRSAHGYVSSFGELSGLSQIGEPKRLELLPYAVSSLTTERGSSNPLADPRSNNLAFGLDMKYAVAPGLTLTTTINPDFGQVEADPAVVNLTAFETYFAERRPFFVEGSGNLDLGLDCDDECASLFYSRRIGHSPQGVDALPNGADVFTRSPAQTTILGAAKLTGRIGPYSVGLMTALTQAETATILSGGARHEQTIEPLANYWVARGRREFANQSSIGLMLTSTARHLVDDFQSLPSSAFSGGLDFDWRPGPQYSVAGYLVGSAVNGNAGVIRGLQENSRHYFQRPDADQQRLDPQLTRLTGSAASLSIRKTGGEHIRFTSTAGFRSPGFDIDDLGFFHRADERFVNNWLELRSDTPAGTFRTRSVSINQYARWNGDHDLLVSGESVNAHTDLANGWDFGGGLNFTRRGFDDRLSRGGPGGLVEGSLEVWQYLATDNRRPVMFSYYGMIGNDQHGSLWRQFQPELTVRPFPALSAVLGVSVANTIADTQWVQQVVDARTHYVFGRLDQTTVSLTGRMNYTVTPTLSLQVYAQPFVSAGAYANFKELVDGRNPEYASRYAPFDFTRTGGMSPDFNYQSFRTTNVIRWEYKPGSALFAVWQQGREDTVNGDFQFNHDFHHLFFNTPARNVFLVKLAYWFNK